MENLQPLIVDRYEWDPPCGFQKFVAAGYPWVGARFKLSQGTYYGVPSWVAQQRDAFLRSSRYGVDLVEGMYHYLDLSQDGADQCDFALKQVALAGGEQKGTLPLMVDVERGGQRQPALTSANVIACASKFSARYLKVTGRRCTLYGGELLRALGITDHMECDRVSVARYTPTLPLGIVQSMGWPYPDEWQYCGDGTGFLSGYPTEAPGCGKSDITVVVNQGGMPALLGTLKAS